MLSNYWKVATHLKNLKKKKTQVTNLFEKHVRQFSPHIPILLQPKGTKVICPWYKLISNQQDQNSSEVKALLNKITITPQIFFQILWPLCMLDMLIILILVVKWINTAVYQYLSTANSLLHSRDLELVTSFVKVHNSRSLFQSNICTCNLFLPGI